MPPARRSRLWCFTWNNYPADYAVALAALGSRYHCYGKEVAPNTGTLHLQGALYFTNGKTLSAVRRLLLGVHFESARGTFQQVRDYCRKDGDFYEDGTPPVDDEERGDGEAERWDNARSLAKSGALDELPADIYIRYYAALKSISRDHMPRVAHLPDVCGIWIYGRSGSGKTHAATTRFPDAFIKPRNIWWDGYSREETVILDDVDKYDVALGGKLKHWADRYAFIGEAKGGGGRFRPARLIVTSQYTIEQIWPDVETQEALRRRFKVVEKLVEIDLIWPDQIE